MAEVDDTHEDRRDGKHRREDDRWLREIIEQLLDDYDRKLKRERARTRAVLISVAVGYLILFVGGLIALYVLEHNDKRDTNTAALASCRRVNVLRGQQNQTAEAAWATVYLSAQRERRLADHGADGLTKTHRQSAEGLGFIAQQFRRTPLTHCHDAVYDAATYVPPVPAPFDPEHSVILKDLQRLIGAPS